MSSNNVLLLACLLVSVPVNLSCQGKRVTDPGPNFKVGASICPATLSVAKVDYKFERPSIYNGTPGKEEYDLAPDDTQTKGKEVRQLWNLKDYRDMNLFMRCRYAGTKETVTVNLPQPLKTCVFTFHDMPGNQPLGSPALECK